MGKRSFGSIFISSIFLFAFLSFAFLTHTRGTRKADLHSGVGREKRLSQSVRSRHSPCHLACVGLFCFFSFLLFFFFSIFRFWFAVAPPRTLANFCGCQVALWISSSELRSGPRTHAPGRESVGDRLLPESALHGRANPTRLALPRLPLRSPLPLRRQPSVANPYSSGQPSALSQRSTTRRPLLAGDRSLVLILQHLACFVQCLDASSISVDEVIRTVSLAHFETIVGALVRIRHCHLDRKLVETRSCTRLSATSGLNDRHIRPYTFSRPCSRS